MSNFEQTMEKHKDERYADRCERDSAANAIRDAMVAVESAGASPELTDATFLLASARARVTALEQAARGVVDLLRGVGDETAWRDGDETDRVFAWHEFAELRRLLSED